MTDLAIVGAGPSGLAAAREAVAQGASVVVIEKFDRVGGLARTLEFEGSRFDIGPHRFYTKNDEVNQLFMQTLGEEAVRVKRLTRILNDGCFFDYPLTPMNAVFGVGFGRGVAIGASYAASRARARLSPKPIDTFEDWIVDRFGRRLYQQFFKTYTEKVWGISCQEISADWAAQRIRGLSLAAALRNALLKDQSTKIKSLVDEFLYPRLGAGQLYEIMAGAVRGEGGQVVIGAKVTEIRREGSRVKALTIKGCDGSYDIEARNFLVSAPLTDLVEMMRPAAPSAVLQAARALRYRDHIGVNLVIEGKSFPDNWMYVHSREVALARIANYRNFSPEMAGGESISPITVEYFATPGDELSSATDEAMIERAVGELTTLRLIEKDQVRAGFVVRSAKAYPLMHIGHQEKVAAIKHWLDGFDNLLPIGRSGMFKYNNQDHAMATGLLAARSSLGLKRYDPWLVNIDAEYHEERED